MGIRTKLSPLGQGATITTITPPVQELYPFTEFNVGVTTISVTWGGQFRVYVVGGGGNGVQHVNQYFVMAHGGGGSGAGFVGEIYLTAGYHTITVGNACEGSSIDNLIIAGAGGNASMNNTISAMAGTGGVIAVNTTTSNVQVQSNGNAGATAIGSACAGGASVYNGWGSGAGSNSSPNRGYVAIQQITSNIHGGGGAN